MTIIKRDTILDDNNGDGRIDLGKENRKTYGVSALYYRGMSNGQYVYTTAKNEPLTRSIVLPNVAPPKLINPTAQTTTKEFKGPISKLSNKTASNKGLVSKQKAEYRIDGLELTDWELNNCAGLFRNYGGPLSNVLFDRISMINAQYAPGQAAGIFYHSNDKLTNATLRNLYYDGVEPITSKGDIYAVITLAGKDKTDCGSKITIEEFDFSNLWTAYTGSSVGEYANRDGLAIEEYYTDGIISRGRINGAADAGIDLKGTGWTIAEMTIANARESVKLWASTKVGAFHSVRPRFAHIMSMRAGLEQEVEFFQPESINPAIPYVRLENGKQTVVLKDADLTSVPPGQVIATCDAASRGSRVIMPGGKIVTV